MCYAQSTASRIKIKFYFVKPWKLYGFFIAGHDVILLCSYPRPFLVRVLKEGGKGGLNWPGSGVQGLTCF